MSPYVQAIQSSAVLADAELIRTTGTGHATATLSDRTEPFKTQLVFPDGRVHIIVERPEPDWLWQTLGDLQCLVDLDEDWDSYSGSPIHVRAIGEGLRLLSRVLTNDAPAPSVVPMSSGGVQFEWHCSGIDLELSVDDDETVAVWYHNSNTGDEWDWDGGSGNQAIDIQALTQVCRQL